MTMAAPLLAAIRYGRNDPVDGVLEGVVRDLQAGGVRIAGYIQRESDTEAGRCPTTHLEDVTTGKLHVISQPLGVGARGCRLDPQALAGVCGELQARLDEGVDLVVLNRFGKGEAQGHGFRDAIGQALLSGVPVLVALNDLYVKDFDEFAGEDSARFCRSRAEVEAWLEQALHRPAQGMAS